MIYFTFAFIYFTFYTLASMDIKKYTVRLAQ